MKRTNQILASSAFFVLLTLAPAMASDYTIDIFGNANLDYTINEDDLSYVVGIIDGTNERTELADANYDGEIDEEDLVQIEEIIEGQEIELAYIDILGDIEIVKKPINRLVNLGWNGIDVTRALGARDLIVAVGSDYRSNLPISYPVISTFPAVGYKAEDCDCEAILSLEPDAIQTNIEAKWAIDAGHEQKRLFKQNLPGIPLISLNMREPETLAKNVIMYGYLIDREVEAEAFVNWFEGYNDLIKSRTEELSGEETPLVYFEYRPYRTKGSGDRYSHWYIMAGGKNIADKSVGSESSLYYTTFDIDPEIVIEQNPDFIFIHASTQLDASSHSYEIDDPSTMADLRDELINRPELADVKAVKNGNVYVVDDSVLGGAGQTVIGTLYAAKWMHPGLFADLDLLEVHQEYVTNFCYLDFDVKKNGVFVYPPLEDVE